MSSGRPAAHGAWLHWGLWGVIVAAYLGVRSTVGFTYPVPWSDEGSFLWQAIAFQERGSLFSPELNPDRHVMWMPPGYALWSGAIFKLTGFSLVLARALSCLYLLLAMTWLAARCRRLALSGACLLVLAVFLHSRVFLFIGNIARMESLLLLMAAGSTALCQARRPYLAVSLSALTPLVHPNGFYYWAGVLVLMAHTLWQAPERRRPARWEWLALAAGACAWLGYGVYVWLNWSHFVSDMAYQMSVKQDLVARKGTFATLAVQPLWLMRAGLLVLLLRFGRGELRPALVTQAAPLLFLTVTSLGSTYRIFSFWLDMLLSVAVLDAAWLLLSRRVPRLRVWLSAVVVALVLWADVAVTDRSWGAAQGWEAEIEGVRYGPGRLLGLGTAQQVPYQTATDAAPVRALLSRLQTEPRPVDVVFYPWSDAFFYSDMRSRTVRFVHPTFSDQLGDVQIFHDSRYQPPALKESMSLRALWVHQVPTQLPDWTELRARDGTETWRYHRQDDKQGLPDK